MPTHQDMEMKTLNLAQDISGVIESISRETNLLTLSHAIDEEKSKGARLVVLQALAARGVDLRTHGPGAEGAPDPFADMNQELKWEPIDMSAPSKLKEHDFGEGHIGKQKLTDEQRILGQFKVKESENRCRDLKKLTTPIERGRGGIVYYTWGHIMPCRKELTENGKITLHYKPHIIYLRACPNCGRINKPDHGVDATCVHCRFELMKNLIIPHFDIFQKDIPDLKKEDFIS